jgi:hypothetical protein
VVEINLSNVGFDGYYWSLELEGGALDDQPWIGVSDAEGQVLGLDDSLILTLDPALAGGVDPSQTLLVRAPGATNNPVAIPLEIVQWGGGELCVNPSPVQIELDSSVDDGATTIEVGNCNPGSLSWSAIVDASWLALDRTEGDGSAGAELVELSVDAGELDPDDTYTATITLESPDAANSPVSVDVELTFAEGVRRPGCGCASRGNAGRLAWLPGLVLLGVTTRRRRDRRGSCA